jgi:hypothetical protein
MIVGPIGAPGRIAARSSGGPHRERWDREGPADPRGEGGTGVAQRRATPGGRVALASTLRERKTTMTTTHALKPSPSPVALRRDGQAAPQWPSYTGTSQLVGTSASGVTVYVDPSLGQPALQNAQDLLGDADRVVAANNAIFGVAGGPTSVIVFALDGATDGTGGADHMACDFANGAAIEVDASFGNSARVSALFEAELSECCMGGNLCGVSTGEALSRWCAAVIGNNALSDFATAPTWYQDGAPDYVNNTDPTDRNADSTGCGMAFLSWLMSQGIGLDKIAQGMVALGDAGTLAQLYANLTGDSAANAFPNFIAAVNNLPNGVTSDDPFGGAPQPAQMAFLPPWALETAAKLFGVILADVVAGKSEKQIVANVRAAMSTGVIPRPRGIPAPAGNGAAVGVCARRSHALKPLA